MVVIRYFPGMVTFSGQLLSCFVLKSYSSTRDDVLCFSGVLSVITGYLAQDPDKLLLVVPRHHSRTAGRHDQSAFTFHCYVRQPLWAHLYLINLLLSSCSPWWHS